jgi:hypothetical protein
VIIDIPHDIVPDAQDFAAVATLRRNRGESDNAYAARRYRMAQAVKLIRQRDPGARHIVDPDLDID